MAVVGVPSTFGVDVERPVGWRRHVEAERGQCGHELVAALLELPPPFLQYRARLGVKGRERRATRRAAVDETLIDLVDDHAPAPRIDLGNDPREFLRTHYRAGGVGGGGQ